MALDLKKLKLQTVVQGIRKRLPFLPLARTLRSKTFRNSRKRRKTFAVAGLVVVSIPAVLLFAYLNRTSAAWWNDEWLYRKPVNITSSAVYTDYQVRITLNTSQLITAGKMNSTCSDIRIVTRDGDILPHWVPTFPAADMCNTTTTKIWTKIPNLSTGQTAVVYIYYGNPSARIESEGEEVFLLFEDFDKDSFSSSKWSLSGGGTIALKDGYIYPSDYGTCPSDSTYRGPILNTILPSGLTDNFRIAAGIQTQNTGSNTYMGGIITTMNNTGAINADGYYMSLLDAWIASTNVSVTAFSAGTAIYSPGGSTLFQNFTGVMEIADDATNGHFFINGTEYGTPSAQPTMTHSFTSFMFQRYCGRAPTGWYDALPINRMHFIYIRQYFATEPTVGSPGTEEQGTGPVAYWRFDEHYGTTIHNTLESVSEDHLIGWWKMDETSGTTMYDEMKQKNVTVAGSPGRVTGITGNAYDFSGSTSQYAYASDSPIHSITGSLTLSAWIKPEAVVDGTSYVIAGKATNEPSPAYSYLLMQYGDEMMFIINSGGVFERTDATNLAAGQWYHVAAVYNAQKATAHIFVNGVRQNSTTTGTIPTSLTDRADYFTIGSLYGGTGYGTYPFNGIIDLVRLYNTPLGAGEISAEYNSMHGAYTGGVSATWDEGARFTDLETEQGSSLHFDQTDDLITMPDVLNLDIADGQDFSISAWFKYDIGQDGTNTMLLGKRSGNNPGDIGYNVHHTSTNDLYMEVSDGTDEFSVYSSDSRFDYSPESSSWHHIVVTFDESSQSGCRIYLNGRDVSSGRTGTLANIGSLENTLLFSIGGEADGGGLYNGNIDEVKFYRRVLSENEVRTEFNRGTSASLGTGDLPSLGDGPVGHWTFDESTGQTAFDTSGFNNHGIAFPPSASAWVPGKYGRAYSTNGTSSYLEIPDNNLYDFAYNDNFSVSVWLNIPAQQVNTSIDHNMVLEKWSLSGGYPFVLRVYNQNSANNGKVFFKRYDGTNNPVITSTYAYNDSRWHYFSLVKRNSTLFLYVDGVLDTTATDTTIGTTTNDSPLYAGKRGGVTPYYFSGLIDDLRIYDYGIPNEQIVRDMNADHPAPGSPVGSPVLHWKFDEMAGKAVHNSLGGESGENAAYWTQDGKINGAVEFKNYSGGVGYFSTSLNDVFNDTFSISMWANLHDDTPEITGTLFSKPYTSYSGPTHQITILEVNSPPSIQATIWRGDTMGSYMSVASQVLTTDEWYHVTVTVDISAPNLTIYINGKEVDSESTATGSYTNHLTRFSLGYLLNARLAEEFYFYGKIDEFKIFPFVLSPQQVRTEYNFGKGIVMGSSSVDSTDHATWSTASSFCVPGSTDPCSSPTSEWKLDERTGTRTLDTSGSNISGNLTNMESTDWLPASKCIYGSCLDFGGTDEFVDISLYINALAIKGKPYGTLELWFKTSSTSAAVPFSISDSDATDDYMGVFIGDWTGSYADESIGFHVMNGGTSNIAMYVRNGHTFYQDGEWHHFVATVNGSHNAIFIDGVEQPVTFAAGSATSSYFSNIAAPDNFRFGSLNTSGTDNYFEGQLDEIRVWAGDTPASARTTAQIIRDYNRGKPLVHWKLDEKTGTTAFDSSMRGLDAQFISVPLWEDGQIANSLHFDGVDDRVSLADTDLLSFGNTAEDRPFSLTAWIKRDTATEFPIVTKSIGGGSTISEWALQLSDTGALSLYLIDNDFTPTYRRWKTSDNPISGLSGWTHVAATYSGSTITLYANGRELPGTQSSVNYTAMHNTISPLYIGALLPGNVTYKRFADGLIDDVRVYNYELTATQVKTIANEGGSVRFAD